MTGYIGQTKKIVCVRVKENVFDVKNGHVSKPAVREHTADKFKYNVKFDNTHVLAWESRYIPRIIREVIEIQYILLAIEKIVKNFLSSETHS